MVLHLGQDLAHFLISDSQQGHLLHLRDTPDSSNANVFIAVTPIPRLSNSSSQLSKPFTPLLLSHLNREVNIPSTKRTSSHFTIAFWTFNSGSAFRTCSDSHSFLSRLNSVNRINGEFLSTILTVYRVVGNFSLTEWTLYSWSKHH